MMINGARTLRKFVNPLGALRSDNGKYSRRGFLNSIFGNKTNQSDEADKSTNKNSVQKTASNGYSSEAQFETKECKLHNLENGPGTMASLNSADALKYYEQMFTIRRLENAASTLYREKTIRGFCHLYSGQEAVAVGMKAAMHDNDSVITAYRCHGWTYLMGVPLMGVLAELTGRQPGCARGKGGSMHMYAKNFYGGNGIVGAQVPLGVGVALAHKYKGEKNVCIAAYGDGAGNQGQVFEVYNMAKLWNIPVIFVCENNGYGMGTSSERSSASTDFYKRGDYVPGIWVDGMDVLAVRDATKFAIDHCNADKGPMLMEVATYRYSGHSMSDPGTSYRSRDEINEVRQSRDPITSFRDKIINANLVSTEEIKNMEAKIRAEVDEVMKKSRTENEIAVSELVTDIYSKPDNLMDVRNIIPTNPLKHTTLNQAVNM